MNLHLTNQELKEWFWLLMLQKEYAIIPVYQFKKMKDVY